MTATQILQTSMEQIDRNLSDFQAGAITHAEYHERNARAWDAIDAAGMREEAFRPFHVEVLD